VSLFIWFSFAISGTLLFAPQSLLFRQIIISFVTTWDIITGSYGISDFSQLIPVLGPLYYILFTVVMTFILLNMFVGLVTEFYNENMKQREASSHGSVNLSFEDRLRKNMRKCVNSLFSKEKVFTLDEVVHLLAYKTYSKHTLESFKEELTQFGVEEQPDYTEAYNTYLNKRHLRDLSGLENGDILTLWNLIEDKIERQIKIHDPDARPYVSQPGIHPRQ